jgi:hypothetical protein
VRFVEGARVFYRVSGPASLSYVGSSNRKLEALLLSLELHVGYVRSLEDSERVRRAALLYLRRHAPYFYPDRMDLFGHLSSLVESLGGLAEPPSLSWKYSWIKSLFGWRAAKETQLRYNRTKLRLIQAVDKALSGDA